MKKKAFTILLTLALLFPTGGTALASSEAVDAELTYRGITVELDGQAVILTDGGGNGVEPFIIGGTTYLPLRAVAGALGLGVDWDGATGTVILTSGGEVKTGSGPQLKSSRTVEARLNYRDIKITFDGVELVPMNGVEVAEPFIIDGTTYLPLRGVASALGLAVDWDGATGTVILTSGFNAEHEGVSYRTVRVSTSAGDVGAHVLTVDPKNSAVTVKPAMVSDTLCGRAGIGDIVSAAGNPLAVITANFMTGDKEGNYPVGNLMIDGNLLFTGSGISSIGIKDDGSLVCGRVGIRARVVPEEGVFPLWNANAINAPEEEIAGNLSALYTPASGESFSAGPGGTALTVSGGTVSSFRTVEPGEEVAIPPDGYVLLMTDEFMKYTNQNYRAAAPGESVELEFFVNIEDGSFNSLDGVEHIISGGPRLVRNGAIYTEIEPQFNGPRITTLPAERVCAGYTSDGRLILAASKGTIQAMRELMLQLGCVEAINLDGGASTALYYNGRTLVPPGRLLAYVLLVYAN